MMIKAYEYIDSLIIDYQKAIDHAIDMLHSGKWSVYTCQKIVDASYNQLRGTVKCCEELELITYEDVDMFLRVINEKQVAITRHFQVMMLKKQIEDEKNYFSKKMR